MHPCSDGKRLRKLAKDGARNASNNNSKENFRKTTKVSLKLMQVTLWENSRKLKPNGLTKSSEKLEYGSKGSSVRIQLP